MFIEKVTLRDFRCFEEATLVCEPLTVIRGKNHEGKSTVAQAIKLAATSCADGTDAQGRGANDKIRSGAKKAFIDLMLRGKNGVQPYEVSYGPGKTGRTLRTENVPELFSRWLERNNERLSCAFDSDYFVRQKPEDQKSILASLVLPTTYDFPAWVKEACLKQDLVPASTEIWSQMPITVIDTLYERSYEARKAAKASLASIHVPERPMKPENAAQDIAAKLTELRARLPKLAKKKQGGTVQIGRLQEQLEQAKRDLADTEQEIEALGTSIMAQKAIIDACDTGLHKRIAGQRKLYDSLQDQFDILSDRIEEQSQIVMLYEGFRDKRICPTCLQMISTEFIENKIKEAKQVAATAGQKQRDIMGQQKELGDIQGSEDALASYNEALQAKSDLQAQYGEKGKPLVQRKAKVQELISAVEEAIDAESAPVDTTDIDNLNAEISKWEAQLGPAIQYSTTLEQIEMALSRQKREEAKVADMEKLVAYFGKDGVKAELIQKNIDAFSTSVNRILEVWGYSAKLSIEPYSFEVTGSRGTLPLKELSVSEKLMFGVALQTAISHHAKINTVVIDKADTFLGVERNRLFSCVNQLISDKVLEQAIVLVSDDRMEAPAKQGVAYYAASEGRLVRL